MLEMVVFFTPNNKPSNQKNCAIVIYTVLQQPGVWRNLYTKTCNQEPQTHSSSYQGLDSRLQGCKLIEEVISLVVIVIIKINQALKGSCFMMLKDHKCRWEKPTWPMNYNFPSGG